MRVCDGDHAIPRRLDARWPPLARPVRAAAGREPALSAATGLTVVSCHRPCSGESEMVNELVRADSTSNWV
jgi:hypothetical protein